MPACAGHQYHPRRDWRQCPARPVLLAVGDGCAWLRPFLSPAPRQRGIVVTSADGGGIGMLPRSEKTKTQLEAEITQLEMQAAWRREQVAKIAAQIRAFQRASAEHLPADQLKKLDHIVHLIEELEVAD